MATRFYLRENTAAPVSPAFDGTFEVVTSPADRKAMFTSVDSGDTLSTVSGFGSVAGEDRLHRQFVSEPLAAGHVFDTTTTYKSYVQVLESAANDNIRPRIGIRIFSQNGSTLRHEVKEVGLFGVNAEWATSLRNKSFIDGDTGNGSYTTVVGDRLVVEYGHGSVDGVSISGSSRWGSAGSADLGENETDTGTTLRPWFETSLTLTIVVVGDASLTIPMTTLSATASVVVEGDVSRNIPMPTLSAAGSVVVEGETSLTIPMPTLSATGTVGDAAIVGTAGLTIPMPTVSATAAVIIEGETALTIPMPTLQSSVSIVVEAETALTIPMPTVVASGESAVFADTSVVIPMPQLAASASVVVEGETALAIPMPTLASDGTVTGAILGDVGLIIPMPTLVATGASLIEGEVALVIPMPVLSADADAGAPPPGGGGSKLKLESSILERLILEDLELVA